MKYTYFVSYEFLYQMGNQSFKSIMSDVYELDFKIECEETFQMLIDKIKKYKGSGNIAVTPINLILLKEV